MGLLRWSRLIATRALVMLARLLGRRTIAPRVRREGQVVVLEVQGGPRSLDDLALRVELADWAAGAPDRELVLIRRDPR